MASRTNCQPSARLVGFRFEPLTSEEIVKRSVYEVTAAKNLRHPRLGLPNFEHACGTCGARRTDASNSDCVVCHSGHIVLPCLVYHPHRVSALVQKLNGICLHCCKRRECGKRGIAKQQSFKKWLQGLLDSDQENPAQKIKEEQSAHPEVEGSGKSQENAADRSTIDENARTNVFADKNRASNIFSEEIVPDSEDESSHASKRLRTSTNGKFTDSTSGGRAKRIQAEVLDLDCEEIIPSTGIKTLRSRQLSKRRVSRLKICRKLPKRRSSGLKGSKEGGPGKGVKIEIVDISDDEDEGLNESSKDGKEAAQLRAENTTPTLSPLEQLSPSPRTVGLNKGLNVNESSKDGKEAAQASLAEAEHTTPTLAPLEQPSPSPRTDEESCIYCTGRDGVIYPKTHLKTLKQKIENVATITKILMEIDEKAKEIPKDYWKYFKDWPQRRRSLLPEEALRILTSIPKETSDKLQERPEDYFLKAVNVPPNCTRILVDNADRDGGVYLQDSHSTTLRSLLTKIKTITVARDGKPIFQGTEQDIWDLQACVSQCFRSNLLGNDGNDKNSRKPEPGSGLQLIRKTFAAKVCSSSARGVVRGDPFIMASEIGIPVEVAADLAVPEVVTSFNFRTLQDYVNNPAQCTLHGITRDGGCLDLKRAASVKLQAGDVVYRSLKDGDEVFINRPPTFHKHALIGLKTLVYDQRVFSINPLICTPLFGDFDGDCLHVFVPQSNEVRAEISELMTIPNQLISSQGGQSMMRLIQDSLLGAYLLTRKDVFLDKVHMEQLQMWCLSRIPVPAVIKSPKGPLWTGRQLFGMTLPGDFDYQSANGKIVISKGEVLRADVSGSAWLKDGLVSSICTSVGPKSALQHLNCAAGVINEWLSGRGFSVGLSDFYLVADCVARRKLEEEVLWALEGAKASSFLHQFIADTDIQLNSVCSPKRCIWSGPSNGPPGGSHALQKAAALQQVAISGFQSVMRDLERVVSQHVTKDNALLRMVNANSKGSLSRMVQQGACLGLQLLQGDLQDKAGFPRAVLHELEGRLTSPELWKAKGLVVNSFFDGLDQKQFFTHAIATRNANTGVQHCGSLFRCLMCFLKDLRMEYDNTVRCLHGSHVFQFSYGGKEGGDASMVEPGEAVGALAATALIEPIYDMVLSSSHQVSGETEQPLQLLQDILEPTPSTVKGMDQRVILRLSKAACRSLQGPEWVALKVRDQLKLVTLGMLTSRMSIEYDEHEEIDGVPKRLPWIGCLELEMAAVWRCDLDVDKILSHLKKIKEFLPTSAGNEPFQGLHFYLRSNSDPRAPLLCFFPLLSANVSLNDAVNEQHHDSMKNIIFPSLLTTAVKGDVRIESVILKWADDCIPVAGAGELVVEVVVKRFSSNRGMAWDTVKSACLPIMELVDWQRSIPFSVQEVRHVFGIEAAFHCILEKLRSLTRSVNKNIRDEHHILVADCASHSGDVNGFTPAGYESFLKGMSKNAPPLAVAVAKAPVLAFEDAAMGRAFDKLVGVTESSICGKRASLGTGADFKLLLKEDKTDKSLFSENLDFETYLASTLRRKPSMEAYSNSRVESGHYFSKPSSFCPKPAVDSSKLSPEAKREKDWRKIKELDQELKRILHDSLTAPGSAISLMEERMVVDEVLPCHPKCQQKIGCGIRHIKIDYHPKFNSTRCFFIVRVDSTECDFSYPKCLEGMAMKDPILLERYKRYRKGISS